MNLCPAPSSLLESLKSLGLENTEAGVTQVTDVSVHQYTATVKRMFLLLTES